ncbi:MAG: adenylyltransferase/cytidyltransferase family protein, partial [Candidatus Micrarchaeia archaeon]
AGHLFALNEARKLCDVLVVVVARDELVLKNKKKLVHPQEYRAAMVDFLKPVDVALLGGRDYMETAGRVKPDVIIYGYDQKELETPGIEVVKLKKRILPEKFKTSKIIEALGL